MYSRAKENRHICRWRLVVDLCTNLTRLLNYFDHAKCVTHTLHEDIHYPDSLWGLAHNYQTIAWWHHDCDGKMTVVNTETGAKVWTLFRSQQGLSAMDVQEVQLWLASQKEKLPKSEYDKNPRRVMRTWARQQGISRESFQSLGLNPPASLQYRGKGTVQTLSWALCVGGEAMGDDTCGDNGFTDSISTLNKKKVESSQWVTAEVPLMECPDRLHE
ncbi:hypothetical protein PM082_018166 [Marasmius tenuissimus]|nr:hypothetical protein PM082_018166 [Marasmius tenuissimus]